MCAPNISEIWYVIDTAAEINQPVHYLIEAEWHIYSSVNYTKHHRFW